MIGSHNKCNYDLIIGACQLRHFLLGILLSVSSSLSDGHMVSQHLIFLIIYHDMCHKKTILVLSVGVATCDSYGWLELTT